MAIGGPVTEISVGGRIFTSASDADVSVDLGGFTPTREMNGNGTSRKIKTPKPWMCEGVQVSVDSDNGDLEFLQANANSNSDSVFTVTFADGNVYQGSGSVDGDVKLSTANTTTTLNFGGSGNLTKQ